MRIALLALALLAAAPLAASDIQPLKITDAWLREPPPAVTTTAGYATLHNPNHMPLTLTGVRSTLGRVELHETRIENGLARMRPVASLSLPPGGTRDLAPGGLHLMLIEPKPAPKAGSRVPLWLQTREAGEVQAEFEVRAGGSQEHSHHH
jgi:copper(I)-binding protein